MRRVLVVEDEAAIREVIALNLRMAGYDVTEAGSAEAGLAAIGGSAPFDVAVLDIMLPGMNGFSLCENIRRDSDSIGIIMLSAKSQEDDKIRGLSIGADDYMTKPFGILELSARVRNLLKRSGTVREESTCLAAGDVKIDKETREVVSCGEKVELTLKEFELLSYLMEHMNRVVTRDELLDNIWGYDYDGETRTLDMHIKTLRQKLKDAGQQIKTVRGVGYRFLKEKER